jgi:hypothetical protein
MMEELKPFFLNAEDDAGDDDIAKLSQNPASRPQGKNFIWV